MSLSRTIKPTTRPHNQITFDCHYNDRGQKCHPLTAKGQVIADELQLTDLARIQKQIWKLETEFEDHLEEFETTLTQKTMELNDEFQRELTRRYS
jgi:hypothetical protein